MLKKTKAMEEPAAEIVNGDYRSNPRHVAASEQAARLDREIEDAAQVMGRKREQAHQADHALKELVSKAVLATEPIRQDDIDRLTRHRAQVEREFTAAEELVAQKRALRDGLRAAIEQLEANLQAETRSVVLRACRPLVKRQMALLHEVAAVNRQIDALVNQTSHVDPVRALPQLEIVEGNGLMWHYLRDLEQFVSQGETVR